MKRARIPASKIVAVLVLFFALSAIGLFVGGIASKNPLAVGGAGAKPPAAASTPTK